MQLPLIAMRVPRWNDSRTCRKLNTYLDLLYLISLNKANKVLDHILILPHRFRYKVYKQSQEELEKRSLEHRLFGKWLHQSYIASKNGINA